MSSACAVPAAPTVSTDQAALTAAIESTALGFAVTRPALLDLCADASVRGLVGVCVPPRAVRYAVELLQGTAVRVVTVANFPFGDAEPEAIQQAIRLAVRHGAHEVDVVAPLADLTTHQWCRAQQVLAGAIEAAGGVPVKVILETAALTPDQLTAAVELAVAAGARWVKTSTGFHPAGGATVETVRRLRTLAPPTVGVKASGGIRTRAQALLLLAAGADRLGTSLAGHILGGAATPASLY